MAYLAKDKDGHFSLTENKPIRGEERWSRSKGKAMVPIIHIDEELLSKIITFTWEDEPVEIIVNKNTLSENRKEGNPIETNTYPKCIRIGRTTYEIVAKFKTFDNEELLVGAVRKSDGITHHEIISYGDEDGKWHLHF